MAIVFIPAVVALLESKEIEVGHELTRNEVESIRDNAAAIVLPEEITKDMTKSRSWGPLGKRVESRCGAVILQVRHICCRLFR